MNASPARALAVGRSWAGIDARWLNPCVIVVAQALMVLLVFPQRDFPVGDDWAYARVVQSILAGQFHLGDSLGPTTLFHACWGALWCLLFGFSFTTLSLANATMGGLAGLACYALLRELAFSPRLSLMGALALTLNPLSIYLAYSFQTDLTFLATLLGALWAFVAAWKRPRGAVYMLVGGLFSVAAVLTRQTGLVAPAAAAFVWLMHRGPRKGMAGAALAVVPPAAAYGLFVVYINGHGGRPWAWSQYAPGTIVAHLTSPSFLPTTMWLVVLAAGLVAFLLLPVFGALAGALWDGLMARGSEQRRFSMAALGRRDRFFVPVGIVVAGAYAALYAGLRVPFNVGADEVQPLGFALSLSGAEGKLPALPLEVWPVLTALVVPLVAALWALLLQGLVGGLRGALSRRDPALVVITLSMLGILALNFSSDYFYDRYLLPLLPGVIVLLLSPLRQRRFSAWPVVGALLLLTVFGLASVRDMYGWRGAEWRAGNALLGQGVAVEEITGSYEWNRWHLWDEGVRQAKVNGWAMDFEAYNRLMTHRYVLSFSPHPAWVVSAPDGTEKRPYAVCAAVPYERPFSPERGYVYILGSDGCAPGIAEAVRER